MSDPKIGDVRVRWDLLRAQCWRCEVCGPQRAVVCAHTFSAGLLLAESLLGLTRALEFHPDDDPRRDTATTHNEGQLIHD